MKRSASLDTLAIESVIDSKDLFRDPRNVQLSSPKPSASGMSLPVLVRICHLQGLHQYDMTAWPSLLDSRSQEPLQVRAVPTEQ